MIPKLNHWMNTYFAFSGRELGLARIIYGIFFVFFDSKWYWLTFGNTISDIPNIFLSINKYNISGLFFSDIPERFFFILAGWILIINYLGLILGFFTKINSFSLGLIIIILQGLTYSFGKIDHTFIHYMSPAILSLTNWGSYVSIESVFKSKKARIQNWPLTILLLCFFLGFFSAGLEKVFDPDYLNVSKHVILPYIYTHIPEKTTHFLSYLGSYQNLAFELAEYAALFVELILPFLIFGGGRKILIFMLIASTFGLFNSIILGIAHYGLVDTYVVIGILLLIKGKHKCYGNLMLVIFILSQIIILADLYNQIIKNNSYFTYARNFIQEYIFYTIFICIYVYLIKGYKIVHTSPKEKTRNDIDYA